MVRRLLAPSLALALAAAWLVLLAPGANAACHIAGFVESEVEAPESAGVVSLVVELQGRQGSCAGTVDVATVDGTAVAGEDYETVSQTLVFDEDDDRVENVDITVLADDEADGGETFTVELSDPTGDISGTGGPATVTIVEDGDQSDADPAADEDDTADAADGDTPDAESTDEDVAGDELDTEDAVGGDAGADEGSGTIGIILAVVAAFVIGVAAFVVLRGRGE